MLVIFVYCAIGETPFLTRRRRKILMSRRGKTAGEMGRKSRAFKLNLNELACPEFGHFGDFTLENCHVDMPNMPKSEKVLKKLMCNPLLFK